MGIWTTKVLRVSKKKNERKKSVRKHMFATYDDWDNRMATVGLMSQNKKKGGGVCHCHSRLISSKASRKYDNSSYRLGHWFHHWFHHHRHNQQRCIDLSMTSKKKKKWRKIWPLSLRIKQKARKEEEKLLVSYLYHKKISGQSALTNK